LTRRLVSGAPHDRQPGVPRIAGIDAGPPAEQEQAAARALHDLGVPAGRTQPRIGRLPRLGAMVHHGDMFTSEATTRGVRISVVSEYAPGRSRPQDQQWFFLYTITITNESAETVQLLARHWVITNASGEIEEVRGPGVVGEQPILGPNESFTYTSGCPLNTAFGTMEGTYEMVAKSGERFAAKIAPFTLSEPYTVH
jgi:ApaG protein